MVQQAKKVIQHLNQLPPGKEVNTCARLAEERLKRLQGNGVDLNKFYQQYDVHRNGRVSYKDFSDILIAVSAGVGREDAMQLAERLDKHKAGSIDYKNLLSSLNQLQREQLSSSSPTPSKATPSKSTPSQPTSENRRVRISLDQPYYINIAENNTAQQPSSSSSSSLFTESALSPTIYSQPIVHTLGTDADDLGIPNAILHSKNFKEGPLELIDRVGRRFYYRNPMNHVTTMLRKKIPPYFVDSTADEKRSQRRRSHSEPPQGAGGKTLGRCVEASLVNSSNESAHQGNNNTERDIVFSRSLRTSIEKKKEGSNRPQETEENVEITSPIKRITQAREEKKSQAKAIEFKVAENAIIRHLDGNTSILRHLLKQQDTSRSGYVNLEELKKALVCAGVPVEKNVVEALFESNAHKVCSGSNQDLALSGGKAMDIEAFVNKIQARAVAPALSHVSGDPGLIRGNKEKEKVRIMKKVLHGLDKIGSPQKLFNDIVGRPTTSLSVDQLRESLHFAGAAVSDAEFKILVSEMDKNRDGRISLLEFDRCMNQAVTTYEHESRDKSRDLLYKSSNYRHSNREVGLLNNDSVSEFPDLGRSRQYRKDNQQWEKLRQHMQKSHKKILRAFESSNPSTLQSPKVSLAKLTKTLAQSGVILGQDDSRLLQERLESCAEGYNEKSVGLESFCEVMGIPMATTDREKIVTLDRADLIRDEGVFSTAQHSIAANPIYSSSMFLQTDEDVLMHDFGKRKRHVQSLGEHAHTAKFWEFEKSIDNPMLFPHPLPSCRPDYSSELDVKMLKQGIVSLKDCKRAPKLFGKSLARLSADLEDRKSLLSEEQQSRGRDSISTTNISGTNRRARSAPPMRSLSDYHELRSSKDFHNQIESFDAEKPRKVSNSHLSLAEKVSKWSGGKLVDYVHGKDPDSMQPSPFQRSDSRESTVSPNSYASTSTNSMGTSDRVSHSGGKFFNSADRGRRTLRRQFDQVARNAPFATDF
eukprot:scaffold9105_cov169-Ochromonas_danica.AAC.1